MTYTVKYKSGKEFRVSGDFAAGQHEGRLIPTVTLDSAAMIYKEYVHAGHVLVLDYRAIIKDEGGEVVFDGPKVNAE